MGPSIQQDLANRDLLPGTHVLDGGYVDADLRVTAQTWHQIEVVGPALGAYSRQRLAGQGYDLSAFVIEWEAQQARCSQGHTSVKWTPGRDVSGDPVAPVQPAVRAPGPKTPPANSPSGRKPTTRRSRGRGNGSRPPRSKPSMLSGPGSRARTCRGSDAVVCAGRDLAD
jgi:hypothetical protein